MFFCLLISLPALADRPSYYPFDVKLGGQLATVSVGMAVIADPVPVDAELEIILPELKGNVFVNFFVSDDKGIIAKGEDKAVEIMMFANTSKSRINQTMSKSSLVPGKTYLANIVANAMTARIIFKVKN